MKKKTHKKVVSTPQCTMKQRKMISFNTDSNQHFSEENAQARDKTFHARDLAVPRVNRRSFIHVKKIRGARNSQNAPPSTTILVLRHLERDTRVVFQYISNFAGSSRLIFAYVRLSKLLLIFVVTC